MAMLGTPQFRSSNTDAKVQFAINALDDQYASLEFGTATDVGGDYIEFRIYDTVSKRVYSNRLSNSMLAIASPEDVIQEIESMIERIAPDQRKKVDKPNKKATPNDEWTNEWIKRQNA